MQSRQARAWREFEEQKRAQWKLENERRRHNYVPFIINFLKVLAERGDLMPLVDMPTLLAGHRAAGALGLSSSGATTTSTPSRVI